MTDDTIQSGQDPDLRPNGRSRLPWELPEVLGGAVLATSGLVALTSVVGAIIEGLSQTSNGLTLESDVAQTLQMATAWAEPYFALLVLVALGLAWWQVQGWKEVADDTRPGTSPLESTTEEFRMAFDYLLRARALAVGAMVMLFVCAVATIGHVVGTFLVESPPGPDNGFLVAEVTSIGAALATGLLLASGGWAGARLCSDVDSAFATDEEDFDPTEAS